MVPQWMLPQQMLASGPVDTVADFYLSHPNGRVVASFFLGGAFMHALHYLFSSAWFRDILSRVRRTVYSPMRSRRVKVDPENPATLTLSDKGGFTREKAQDLVESQSIREYNDHSSLIFVLNLCLLLATFTSFITLLAFRNGWQTGCTFVVAWAGMSSQVARLLGMLILILEITVLLDMKKWTVWGLRVMLVIALVFIFAAQATNTGTTGVPTGAQAAFCYRQFFLPTSLVSSIIRLLLESYLGARVLILLWSHKRLFDDDICVSRPLARVLSLFVFDMMTVVPDAKTTSVQAQFIPFSIGTILVIVTFNWKKCHKKHARSEVQSLIIFNKPPATGDPLLVPTPFTLHFPRELRTSHSWCSESDHPIPETSDEAILEITAPSRSLSVRTSESGRHSTQSVENAIVTRAMPAYTRSPRKVELPPPTPPSGFPIPVSAPAQLTGFSGNVKPGRRILSSQLALAAELERAQALSEREQERLEGVQARLEEDIIRLAQPALPPLPAGPHGELIVRDEDDISVRSQDYSQRPMITPASAFFGPDVQRNKSNRKTRRITHPSPAPTQGSFMLSPYESVRSYFRESYDSRMTRTSEEGSSGSSNASGSIKRKGSSNKRNTFLSPTDSLSGKSPWKSNSRFSLASLRSRSREELPTVREQSPDSGDQQRLLPATVVIGRVPSSSKRRTFGQASTPTGKRATNRPSVLNLYAGLPPMPVLSPPPQSATPFTPFTALSAASNSRAAPQIRELPMPSVRVLPATPEPAYRAGTPPVSARSPAWISRPIRRESVVKGPRPLPATPILSPGLGRGASSGWPTAAVVPGFGAGGGTTARSPASSHGGQLDPRRIDGGVQGFLTRSSTGRTRRSSYPSVYSMDSPVEEHDSDAKSL